MEPPPKRRRLSVEPGEQDPTGTSGQSTPRSLSLPVSPPRKRRGRQTAAQSEGDEGGKEHAQISSASSTQTDIPLSTHQVNQTFKSPFQLTWVQDLPDAANNDAVTLRDILGDPLIAECWDFNYLHDVDFLISHFDEDTRHLVQVHVIHGFWKKEDTSRLMLQVSPLVFHGLGCMSSPSAPEPPLLTEAIGAS